MMRLRSLAGLVATAIAVLAFTMPAQAAGIAGDQLLFFYDGRSGRVPFFGVTNPSPDRNVTVEIVFYPESLQGRLGQFRTTLAPLGHAVIDPTTAAGGVAIGNAGLAVVTPVASNGRAIVPPEPLVGTLTLANVPLNSAFGENPIGRDATTSGGSRPDTGTAVDGTTVFYERLQPSTLMVPVFFNPDDLGPAAQDGNRVVLITFDDQYGSAFDIGPRSDTVEATIFDGAGSTLAETQVSVQGVRLTHLQEVAGAAPLSSSGKAFFDVEAGSGNFLGLFSQSLGPFGAGQRMPAVFADATNASSIEDAATSGDQLLFFYDGRSGRVPFFSIGNPSPSTAITVEVVFYSQSLQNRLGVETISIAAAGHAVVDPNQAAGGAAIGNAGLAVVTAVRAGTSEPVVPPEPIVGTFTLANVPLRSAFGENPIGRLAVSSGGARGAAGTTIDGSAIAFQRITPSMLIVPVFFNPTQLGPVENDGNRVVLVAFGDEYGSRFDVRPRGDTVGASIFDSGGDLVSSKNVGVSGVHVTNVQALASPTSLSASGKILLDVDAGSGSVFGLFSQSLGAFGAGQRLPSIDVGELPTPTPDATATRPPSATATPVSTKTPTPTATKTPTPSPAPTASPSPAPTPSPVPGLTIAGIPQSLCRNGVLNAGEECDDGPGNYECKNDPDYQPACGPGSNLNWTCAYCAQTYEIGTPDFSDPVCSSGQVLIAIQPLADRVCSTVSQGEISTCAVTVGGVTTQTICPAITQFEQPVGDLDGLVEGFQQTKCWGRACLSTIGLGGDCSVQGLGNSCTIVVGGTPTSGTCLDQGGGKMYCLGEAVSLAN